jgi:hypothetical protein
MAQPRMNVSLGGSQDAPEAVLTLLPGSGAEGSVTLSATQLLELIVALGEARVRLLLGKHPGLDTNPVQAVVGPAWAVRPEALTEGSMLAFAHPAYGSVGFVLPAVDVERMVRALTSHLGMVRSGETEMSKN